MAGETPFSIPGGYIGDAKKFLQVISGLSALLWTSKNDERVIAIHSFAVYNEWTIQ